MSSEEATSAAPPAGDANHAANTTDNANEEELVLDISGDQRADMTGVVLHPKLEELIMMNNRFTKIEGINHLTCLQKLVLRSNLIPKIENIDGLTNLRELDFYDNKLAVIENINFPHLTFLDLSFNEIREIPPIPHAQLPHITQLYMISNKIVTLSPGLRELTSLKLLELGANRIRVIQNLDTLVNLEQLWLGKNKITTIQNLETLTNLQKLSIQSNRITEVGEGLRTLVNLEELYISHNGIRELRGLDSLVRLKTLDIAANQITSLEGVAMLTGLEELWCNNNALDNWEELSTHLRQLTQLKTLYLEGNPISTHPMYKQRIIHMLPNLEQLDADTIRGGRR